MMRSAQRPSKNSQARGLRELHKMFLQRGEEQRMVLASHAFTFRQRAVNTLSQEIQRGRKILLPFFLGLGLVVLGSSGCGQTVKPVTSPAAGQVDAYFGGPFNVGGSDLGKSTSTFDHVAKQIGVSSFISTQTAPVPTQIINGTFVTAGTGFLNITENFATTSSGVIGAQNPPIGGAWAVEIPGAGALANLLSLSTTGNMISVRAAPAAMAENTACPNFSNQNPFLYVTIPNTKLTSDTADYGGV